SEKGCGTSVKVEIPFLEEKTVPSEKGEYITGELKPVVLIAEDDAVNQFYLKTILKLGKFECITVKNGKMAIEECKKNPRIGLVLMDIKMPLMGGIEATRQIRHFHPTLPILAVTALALKEDKKMALEAGCNDYLAKPFKKEVLLEKVRHYLSVPVNRQPRSVESLLSRKGNG
ncbi:MAG: response regulator, partial [Mariniphaga sp.]